MTADELSRRVTERELSEWMVRGKPLWPRRLELLLAQLTAVLAKVNGTKVEIGDFDLFSDERIRPPAATSAEEGAQALGVLSGGLGVKVLGRKRKERERAALKEK